MNKPDSHFSVLSSVNIPEVSTRCKLHSSQRELGGLETLKQLPTCMVHGEDTAFLQSIRQVSRLGANHEFFRLRGDGKPLEVFSQRCDCWDRWWDMADGFGGGSMTEAKELRPEEGKAKPKTPRTKAMTVGQLRFLR